MSKINWKHVDNVSRILIQNGAVSHVIWSRLLLLINNSKVGTDWVKARSKVLLTLSAYVEARGELWHQYAVLYKVMYQYQHSTPEFWGYVRQKVAYFGNILIFSERFKEGHNKIFTTRMVVTVQEAHRRFERGFQVEVEDGIIQKMEPYGDDGYKITILKWYDPEDNGDPTYTTNLRTETYVDWYWR